jgi:signal transduction histidine kinase
MANSYATLRERAREFIDDVLLYRGTAPALEAQIGEHARQKTVLVTRPLVLVACFGGLLWWPFDFVLYGDRPRIVHFFALWRLATVAYCAVYYFTCDRSGFLRRHCVLWGTFLGSCIHFVIAASLGSIGTVSQPWFGSLYLAPIMSVPFFLRLPARVAGTLTVAVAGLVGFFGAHPANLSHPDVGTSVGLMLFSSAIAVGAGHGTYHMFREGYLRSLELAQRTAELEALSRGLAERVEARTRELRLLAAHVEALRESERGALARELHDELGQLLTGMRMELEAADRVRARGADASAELAHLMELLDATLASTRSVLSHLRPRVLDDFGLTAALEWLASDTRRRSGLDVRFLATPDDFDVRGEAATGVFRIVQESLTNAMRHARAKSIRVSATLDAEGLVATVTDDGVGLAPVAQRRANSLGLLGMRERAIALGGSFEITSPSVGGTRVTVRLPLASVGTKGAT